MTFSFTPRSLLSRLPVSLPGSIFQSENRRFATARGARHYRPGSVALSRHKENPVRYITGHTLNIDGGLGGAAPMGHSADRTVVMK